MIRLIWPFLICLLLSKGLMIKAELDDRIYEKGIKVSDMEFKKIKLIQKKFHGEWNYMIKPRKN